MPKQTTLPGMGNDQPLGKGDFPKWLRQWRAESRNSLMEVGVLLDVSHQAVSDWEKGESQPQVKYLMKLAEVSGADLFYLLHLAHGTPMPGGTDWVLNRPMLLDIIKVLSGMDDRELAAYRGLIGLVNGAVQEEDNDRTADSRNKGSEGGKNTGANPARAHERKPAGA